MNDTDRIFIAELEQLLGRNERTIRSWIRDATRIRESVGIVPAGAGYLPRSLWPEQENAGRRRIFWRWDQVDGLVAFAADKDSRRGWQSASTAS